MPEPLAKQEAAAAMAYIEDNTPALSVFNKRQQVT